MSEWGVGRGTAEFPTDAEPLGSILFRPDRRYSGHATGCRCDARFTAIRGGGEEMPTMRRVVVMIDLDWPISHHFHILDGIDRYARECGRWEYSINPYADQLLMGRRRGAAPNGILARATPALAQRARAAGVP